MDLEQRPQTGRISTAIWKGSGFESLEFATIDRLDTGGFLLSGAVVVANDNDSYAARYRIMVDADWRTRDVEIDLERTDTPARRLSLRSNQDREWGVTRDENGERLHLPEFDGLSDIDLGCTPATNLLPIKRFGLDIGESAETTAVWIDFPSLEIQQLPQRYTRTSARTYRYQSFLSDFRADLEVDDFGVVNRYDRFWLRLSHAARDGA